jgi:glucokinase
MGLTPGSELELEIMRALMPRHRDLYAELLVSGPGLARLYRVLAQINGTEAEDLAPATISSRAQCSEDALCVLALNTFCALLGSVCGDFLLANGSYGGLYLAGGFIPQMTEFLTQSSFHQRLVTKGAMHDMLVAVPVYVITSGQPGLIGAAHAPL